MVTNNANKRSEPKVAPSDRDPSYNWADRSRSESDISELSNFEAYMKDFQLRLAQIRAKLIKPSFFGEGFDVNRFCDLLENFVLLYWDLYRSTTIEDIISACLHAFKHIVKKSILDYTLTSSFVLALRNIFTGVCIQSGVSESIKSIIGGYEALKQSELAIRIREALSYLISFSAFSFLNINPTSNEKRVRDYSHLLSKNPIQFGSEMLISLLKLLEFALENGKAYWYTGDINHLLFKDDKIRKWNSDYLDLIDLAHIVKNPPQDFDIGAFEMRLKETIDLALRYISVPELMGKHENQILVNRIKELREIQRSLQLTQAAQTTRAPPMSILTYGSSNIGKSSFGKILFQHFAKISTHLGRPLSHEDKYHYERVVSDKYWSGFTTAQWCVSMDDIAVSLPSKASSDETLDEIIRINNTVAFIPEQAQIEGKGTVPVRPRLFLGSTNTKDLNAQYWFSCPFAVQRRFEYTIVLSVKDEYQSHSSPGMLDRDLIPDTMGYDDLWNIVVEKPMPGKNVANTTRVAARYVKVFETSSITKFLDWYAGEIELYYARCDAITNLSKRYDMTFMCEHCARLECVCSNCPKCGTFCTCATIQSGFVAAAATYGVYTYILLAFLGWFLALESLLSVLERHNYSPIAYGSAFFNVRIKRLRRHLQSYILRNSVGRIRSLLTPSGSSKSILYMLAVVIPIICVYKMARRKDTTIQGSLFSSQPVKILNEQPNIWHTRPTHELATDDLPPALRSSKSLTIDDQLKLLARQVFAMKLTLNDGKYVMGQCVALGGQLYATNAHYFLHPVREIEVSMSGVSDPIGNRSTFLYNPDDVKLDKRNDIAVFCVRSLPPRKGIYDRILTKSKSLNMTLGHFITRDYVSGLETSRLVRSMLTRPEHVRGLDMDVSIHTQIVSGVPDDYVTIKGECGGLYVGVYDGRCVPLGLHVGFKHDVGKMLAISICQHKLKRLMDQFDSLFTVQDAPPVLTTKNGKPQRLMPIHRKSPLNFVEGHASVYGGLKSHVPTRSRVAKTFLAQTLVESTQGDGRFAIEIKTGAPEMKGYRPTQQALSKLVTPSENVNASLVDEVAGRFLHDIISQLPDEELALISPLSLDDAINGVDGVQFLDGIKRGTSAGYPWRHSKRPLLKALTGDRVTVKHEVLSRIHDIEDKYISGHRYRPVFIATLKDEALPLEKVKAGKTRVFAAAPLDFLLVTRKLLLPFIRVMQRNKFLFETAIGCQAQSKEWERLYEHLATNPIDQTVAGDYASFDKRMSPIFMLAAFKIIREICARAGYTKHELRAIECIAHDTCFSNQDYFGELVMFHGSNPSGHPLTTVLNSLVNSLYMRYAYVQLNPKREVVSFCRNVKLITYGDDNIMTVSSSAMWFNHTAIQRVLAESDIVYTMADKNAESRPFISLFEASFLKRSFRYDEHIGSMVGPLEHDSIAKMLTMCVHSTSYVPQYHMLTIIKTALEEYFWYGMDVFEDRCSRFRSILVKTNKYTEEEIEASIPKYGELLERYDEASKPFK